MRSRRMRLTAPALALSLGLVAAACGDDDDGGGGEAADTTAEATATTAGGTATSAGATTTRAATATTAAAGGGAAFEAITYDESAQCGTAGYEGNVAKLEAVDELTFRLTLCRPDAAIPKKVAFSSLQIVPQEYLDETGGTGDLVEQPIGTGPYKLEAWERGSQIVLSANEDYWGDAPLAETAVFRWSEEAAQRLVELQSGAVDGIDNVGTDDFATVEGDSNLELVERDALNVFYLGFNVDQEPFSNEQLRQAIGYAIDKDRIVTNFYPPGSDVATQFLPPQIAGHEEGFVGFTADQARARQLLAEAGYPNGLDLTLSYRDVVRGYLPQPAVVAQDIQAQLAQVGINLTLDQQESGAFIDAANAGQLGFYMLGWGADFPDATNFFDYHFAGTFPAFGTQFPDMVDTIGQAAVIPEEAARGDLYAQVNDQLFTHAQAIPIAHGGSAVAYKAGVTDAHASPLSNESLAVMGLEGQDQFTFLQNGEPSGLYCADETDGEALRVCEQIGESLLAYEVGGTESIPSLATEYESSPDGTVWTFTLRPDVTFHDGSTFDANDVVESYRAQWDAADPRHVGREGTFTYWGGLFGGFLNPPAETGG